MATKTVTPEVTREVKANLRENEELLIVNAEVLNMTASAFGIQDDIENQSKFVRAFLFEAVRNQLKVSTTRTIAQWEAVIDKAARLRPTMTREQVIVEVLASRKAKDLQQKAQAAAELKKTL